MIISDLSYLEPIFEAHTIAGEGWGKGTIPPGQKKKMAKYGSTYQYQSTTQTQYANTGNIVVVKGPNFGGVSVTSGSIVQYQSSSQKQK